MSTSGLSTARLGRLHDLMARQLEQGRAPGVVTAVSRRGEAHVDAIGEMAFGGAPMKRDTIFRIASMTKPITAVAAMILVEECELRLDDDVDRWLPELAGRRVLKRIDGPLDETVPANRPITVRDLLTFRLGFGTVLAPLGSSPILRVPSELLLGQGPPNPFEVPPADEWIRRFGELPLLHQPGERWMYNTGSEVLGVLIARASGQPFERFLEERIFEPLGMKDTGFHVPSGKIDRLATSYSTSGDSGDLHVYDDAAGGQWSQPPAFPSGGGGLVSTVDDYLAFGEMLLHRGTHAGARLLSRLSVEAMTTDQLTPDQRVGTEPFLGERRSWGFGVSIVKQRDSIDAVPGRFGWDGGLGTSWYSDPTEDLVGIVLTQAAWASPSGPELYQDFWTSAYAAIDD